ncbi:MAG TPA: OB-fold nucleic acid binding domain-containing protein [Acidimicrobiales bacterium]|nr:OB-fold nucleic acid binding domain-containing protein [Acidimicrobiales bacterium]
MRDDWLGCLEAARRGDGQVARLAEVRPRELVVARGEITESSALPVGSSVAYRCVLSDGSGRLSLVFLGRRRVAGLEPGARCCATGRVATYSGELVLWNPHYCIEQGRAPQRG